MGRKNKRRPAPATGPAFAVLDPPGDRWAKPTKMDDVQVAFPADALSYMPEWEDIPEPFKSYDHPFTYFAGKWFGEGADRRCLEPKLGIDKEMGIRHLGAILRSFAPKHEHKMAAVGYLMSRWFTLINPPEPPP